MTEGQFVLSHSDGTRTVYPLHGAELSIGQSGGTHWLTVQATARSVEWTTDDGEPEPPTIDISFRIAGPAPMAWVGREFVVPDGRDEQTKYYPAWLSYAEGYETLGSCVVSVGCMTGNAFAVRVVGRGTLSGCALEVVGAFLFKGSVEVESSVADQN